MFVSAYSVLQTEKSIQLEQLWMKHSNLLQQKEKIIEMFDAKVEAEGIEFDALRLFGRLKILLLNWKDNKTESSQSVKPISNLTNSEIWNMPYDKLREYTAEQQEQIQRKKQTLTIYDI